MSDLSHGNNLPRALEAEQIYPEQRGEQLLEPERLDATQAARVDTIAAAQRNAGKARSSAWWWAPLAGTAIGAAALGWSLWRAP